MKIINQKKGDILVRIDPLEHQFLSDYVARKRMEGYDVTMIGIIRESISKTIKSLKK